MPNNKIGLIALLAGVAASRVMAGDLTSYVNGDVLICFRNGGDNDLVVDVGPIATYTNLSQGQRIDVSTGKYTGTHLHFVSTNSVNWSAFTWFPDSTLFITRARTSPDTLTTPWVRKTGANQSFAVFQMQTIPPGAVDEAAYVPPGAGGIPNTATAVVEGNLSTGNPDYVTGKSYNDAIGSGANFNGGFQGNPEFTTTNNFTKLAKPARADFYQLTPSASGTGSGKLLGYFELSTNGSMAYVAYPSSVPVVKSLVRSGNVNTISYTSGIYGTYTLRATNRLDSGTAKTNWPAVAVLNTGDTSLHSVNDTTTEDAKFYVITTQ